jgi:hypothetical protein
MSILRIRSIFRIPPSIMPNMFLSTTPNPNAVVFAHYILLLHPQIYFGFRYRTFYFTSMMLIGMIFEIIHWILLTLERQESEFVVAGPAFVSVAIHRSFQNIAGLNDANWTMHGIFAGVNLLALILQVGGGAIAWSGRAVMGMAVVKGCLVCQLIGIAMFICITARLVWSTLEVKDIKNGVDECRRFLSGKTPYV